MHSEIFFVITSVSVIIVTILLVIALVYIVKILHDITHISTKVRDESDEIIKDVETARLAIKRDGLKFGNVVTFFGNFFKRKHTAKDKTKK